MASRYVDMIGERLQTKFERQLLEDLAYYGVRRSDLRVEWIDACGEGHCTHAFGGDLEEVSGLAVLGAEGDAVAEGWMDFLQGDRDSPLHVFWLYLSICERGQWKKVKSQPTLPEHIWSRLTDETRFLCAKEGSYDSRWSHDPCVRAWLRRGSGDRAKFEQALARAGNAPPEAHDAP